MLLGTSQECALQTDSFLAASWWDFWGTSRWDCHLGATWLLGPEGSLWRGKLMISEYQQTAGAGKEVVVVLIIRAWSLPGPRGLIAFS